MVSTAQIGWATTPDSFLACDTWSDVPNPRQRPPLASKPNQDRPLRITDVPPEFAGAVVMRSGTHERAEPRGELDAEELSEDFLEEVVDDAPEPAPAAAPMVTSTRVRVPTPAAAPVSEQRRAAPEVAPTVTRTAVSTSAAAEAPPPAMRGPKPDSPTVLVAEDDASIRMMIVRALATQYTVYEAIDGQHASELLDRIPAPACIVSDVMMPRMDGIGLAKKVKATASLKWTPLVFLTAKNSPLDVVQGINAGARHYLSKPFKMKELLEKVGSVLGTAAKKA
jgi:CheY-like chemotaxis protein